MARTIKIDLFTDTVCPWCLVGRVRLEKAIAALPADVTVDVEEHPFYLDPNTPDDGVVVADMLRQRYGRSPEELWERVESEAKKSGVELDLSQQPRSYPTRKGHTLVRLARDKGTQHALGNAIAWAYFMEHRQTHDDAVLAEIAAAHGFTRAEALAAVRDDAALEITHNQAIAAAQQGIRGVPFFVFNNSFAVSGSQPEAVFAQALDAALDPEKLNAMR